MLPAWLARTILAACTFGGIGWTVYARFHPDLGEPWTTSWLLKKAQSACDQIAVLIMLVLFCLILDAAPGIGHWTAFLIMVAAYCLGHGLWSLPTYP